MHSFFEWDDEIAADSYRRKEATQLLRQIEVKTIKDDKPIFVRAYQIISSLMDTDIRSIPINEVSDDNMHIIKLSMLRDLRGVHTRLIRFDEHENFKKAASYVQWAIKILSTEKESTETKEPSEILKAVG